MSGLPSATWALSPSPPSSSAAALPTLKITTKKRKREHKPPKPQPKTQHRGKNLTGTLDRPWNRLKPLTPTQWQTRIHSNAVNLNTKHPLTHSPLRFLVGIDPSVASPALAVTDLQNQTTNLYFFRTRKTEHSSPPITTPHGHTFQFHLLEPWTHEQTAAALYRFQRFRAKLLPLTQITQTLPPDQTLIGIEHYAFAISNSSSITTLAECGGVLRNLLVEQKHHLAEIPPSSIKKVFAHKGNASKIHMAQHFRNFLDFDLGTLIGLQPQSHYKHTIVHPVEDLVDAFAVQITMAQAFLP